MKKHRISLGTENRLTQVYSYPNDPRTPEAETLAETILYWFRQTLDRDGYSSAKASIDIVGSNYFLEIEGPDELSAYGPRLQAFLTDGWIALGIVSQLKQEKKTDWPKGTFKATNTPWQVKQDTVWDPMDCGQWRFFMPLGMAMLNQRTLNFFHYPPMRLLDEMRDYLNDPVPKRLQELQMANGVKNMQDTMALNTVMDGAPIAAPDDQGTVYLVNPTNTVHLLPIDHFHEYQRSQVRTLLNRVGDDQTVPIVCYGSPAKSVFQDLYLEPNDRPRNHDVRTTEIISGRKTSVFFSGHPYAWFAQAQISATTEVGVGRIVLPDNAEEANKKVASLKKKMIADLICSRWQVEMSNDPTQDAQQVLNAAKEYWNDPDQDLEVCALMRHQGSLTYPEDSLKFHFSISLEDARKQCAINGNNPCGD